MELDDLLEDLLEDVGRAARRGARNLAQQTRGPRRTIRRTVRASAGIIGGFLLLLGIALVALGDPGVIRTILGALILTGGLGAGATAVIADVLDRRDPDVVRARAVKRGEVTPDMIDDDLSELPKDVRREFSRVLQGRRLVSDLAADGWVEPSAMLELDGQIARLHRLLVHDQRGQMIGGQPSQPLRAQVSELGDLLVALADEAVNLQVADLSATRTVAVTLTDAREHLVALRQARAEVQQADHLGQRRHDDGQAMPGN